MLSPPKKMEPIKGSIFTLPPALSLKYETYFQKQTFLFDFFGVFVTKQIMDFSWGYPLHNHHSAKKKMQNYKGISMKKLRRRWDSWVSNPWDDRI